MADQDDSVKAQRRDQNKFDITQEQLEQIVLAYQKRTYIEDLQKIDELGGIDQILDKLKTSLNLSTTPPSGGIALNSKDDRDEEFGSNAREKPERTTFCELLGEQLEDFMLRLLIVCAIFALVTELSFADADHIKYAWIEGVSILLAVAFVSCFGAGSDYNKETQFIKQQEDVHRSQTVTVLRQDGVNTKNRDELSVGDICKIVSGMEIPVDGICLNASGVQVDESAMTGESDHLPRDTYEACMQKKKIHEQLNPNSFGVHDVPSCVMLSGTAVTTGEGWFIVTVVGENSCEGKIQASLDDKTEEKTPLQIMLNIIATDIGKLGMFCAILIFHALVLRSFIEGMVRMDFDLFGGEFSEDDGSNCRLRYSTHASFTT